jgi:hypothetical protein
MFSSGKGIRNAGWPLTAVFCFAASAFAQKPMMAVDKNLPLSAAQTAAVRTHQGADGFAPWVEHC